MYNRKKDFLLYCGISKGDFNSIRHLLWDRNVKAIHIAVMLAGGIGVLILLINLILKSSVIYPYVFLVCGSAVIFALIEIIKKVKAVNEIWKIFVCYAGIILVCIYAGILTTRVSHYSVPATSIIVFIALLPLSIDDRPIRMYAVMLGETIGYLVASCAFKSPGAFSMDVVNAVTFCAIGMVLYGVICTRNVHEIYQRIRIEKIQNNVISSLATVVEERDENTGQHIQRTEFYVKKMLEKLTKYDYYSRLSEEYINNVILAAPMHDIGKIKIPDSILNKPGRLTDEEFEIMKKHSVYGGEIIKKTITNVEEKGYCEVAYNIARYHHERYDGKGYPDGLKGTEIPLEARIMALADVYDALVSKRVYKDAFPKEKAIQIIEEGSGTQFDPDLVPIFLDCIK